MQLGGISETTKNNKKLIIRSRFFGKFGSQIRNFSFASSYRVIFIFVTFWTLVVSLLRVTVKSH